MKNSSTSHSIYSCSLFSLSKYLCGGGNECSCFFYFNQRRRAEIVCRAGGYKCFIEFNYVEMFIMSDVYNWRKALPIKSRNYFPIFSMSRKFLYVFSSLFMLMFKIDFYFNRKAVH